MSLQQLSERVYIYRGGVNFGVITAPEKRLILVDSGLDSGSARKALRPFLEEGYTLAAIINTHSHADHIGGNADLVKRTGCQVWAPAKERPMILWPALEPMALYGGAAVPPAMQVKFLVAQPTPEVLELPAAPCRFNLAGVDLELVNVPGHAFDQVAVAIDGVLIAADSIFQPDIIDKHPVIFLVNVAEYIAGLDLLAGRPERHVLPGHGELIDRQAEPVDPLPAIIAYNKQSLERLQAAILDSLAGGPLGLEELLYATVGRLGKVMESEPQFFLDRAAISAHLTFLTYQGRVQAYYVEGKRLLRRCQKAGT